MPRTSPSTPTILVTDAGRGSAVACIRSLGRRGWRVIAAAAEAGSPGLRSRYAHDRLVYPAPEAKPDAFVDSLLRAARERGVDLIIPVTDAAILPLSQARDCFAGVCQLAVPEPDALEVVTNKQKTLALAEALGVPVPRTALVHTAAEALARGPALGWPLVLKPLRSRLYHEGGQIEAFTVTYAENAERLAEAMGRFEGRCPVLIQEYYRGVGHGVELLMDRGRPLAAFQHRRLREVPVHGGASSFRESVGLDPQLYRHAVELLGALGWTGLAMVEFKLGAAGPRLMEINGRIWGSLPLAVHSGMDFPARLAELYLNGAPAATGPSTAYRPGVRSRNLELDVLWVGTVLRGRRRYAFLEMPRRKQAALALLGLLNPANRFDILSLEDPRPGLAEVTRLLGKLGHKLRDAQ
ncbi:MAG TPA: ATP-grasp domain-containing protein [Chloroflexaceae bacterium]|nr:ATP-grasp domain-containing protein [Chloroflexaceae bacterium]